MTLELSADTLRLSAAQCDILSFPQTGFPHPWKVSPLRKDFFLPLTSLVLRTSPELLSCLDFLLPSPPLPPPRWAANTLSAAGTLSLSYSLRLKTFFKLYYKKYNTLKLPRSLCISGHFYTVRVPLDFTLSLMNILLCTYLFTPQLKNPWQN